jgi:hypothetical protein
MGLRVCARQNRLALDVLLAVFFVVLDTVLTLAGTSWWPAHPGTLAWTMLAVQGLADASLVFRRRAPMLVIAILGGFSLLISLLISPAGLITPETPGPCGRPSEPFSPHTGRSTTARTGARRSRPSAR